MIARDKIDHLVAGYAIAITIGIQSTPLIGFIAGAVAGAAKELVWDWWLGKGEPEWFDFIATLIGAALALLIIMR